MNLSTKFIINSRFCHLFPHSFPLSRPDYFDANLRHHSISSMTIQYVSLRDRNTFKNTCQKQNKHDNNTIIPPKIINSKCLISNLQSVELDFAEKSSFFFFEKISIDGEWEEGDSGWGTTCAKQRNVQKWKVNKHLIQGCGSGSGKEMASMSHCGRKLNRIFHLRIACLSSLHFRLTVLGHFEPYRTGSANQVLLSTSVLSYPI